MVYIYLNLNSLQPKMFVSTLVEIDLGFWRRKFLYFINAFLPIFYNLPFEKGMARHFYILKFPSPKDALCQVWLKLAQWFERRWWKCENFTDRQMVRRWTIGNQNFQLRWAKNKPLTVSTVILFYIWMLLLFSFH